MPISIYFSIELVTLYLNAAIAVAAFLALGQIVVAREVAITNSKREAIKLATEMVKFYLDRCVEANSKSFDYKQGKNIRQVRLPNRLSDFEIEEATKKVPKDVLKDAYKQFKERDEHHPELDRYILNEMNSLEVFATPFVSRVADSETAFNSIGSSFCFSVESLWFEYVFYRSHKTDPNYFSSTIRLYNLWKGKMDKNKLETERIELEKQIERIVDTDIKPIGVK